MIDEELLEEIVSSNDCASIQEVMDEYESQTGERFSYDAMRKKIKSIKSTGFPTEDNSKRFDLLQALKDNAKKPAKRKNVAQKNENMLLISPNDLHIGKYSHIDEVGESFNMEKAIARLDEGIDGILRLAKNHNVSEITLVIGNDIVHTDTVFGTTTAGTPQDKEGRWWEQFNMAVVSMTRVIDILWASSKKLNIVHVMSNHDYQTGYYLAQCLRAYFKDYDINWDITANPRKYMLFGKSLLGFTHGDSAKWRDLPLIMAGESKHAWAESDYRYFYLGHIHSTKNISFLVGEDISSVLVQHLRSPSGTDAWHKANGYMAQPAIEGFVICPEKGQIARLTHNF